MLSIRNHCMQLCSVAAQNLMYKASLERSFVLDNLGFLTQTSKKIDFSYRRYLSLVNRDEGDSNASEGPFPLTSNCN
jgi:hypothetical protein